MAELLPSIDIAVSIEPREFLERMVVIGERTGQFSVERHYDATKNGKLDIINFRFLGSSPHTEVGGQLIGRDDILRRVLVENARALVGPLRPPLELQAPQVVIHRVSCRCES